MKHDAPGHSSTDEDIDAFIRTIDTDGDGDIGLDELVSFITEGKTARVRKKSGANKSAATGSTDAMETRVVPKPRRPVMKRFTMMSVSKSDVLPLPSRAVPSARWRWAARRVVQEIRSVRMFMPTAEGESRSREMKEILRTPAMRLELDRALFSHENDEELQHKKLVNFNKGGDQEVETFRPAAPHLFQICSKILRKPRRRRENADLMILLEMLELNPFLLDSLDTPCRLQLARRLRIRRYKSGERIFEAGKEECALYFIFTGSVEMGVNIGVRLTLAVYGPGDTFGDQQLKTPRVRRVTAKCREDSEVAIVRFKDIDKSKKALHRLDTLEKLRLLQKLPYFVHMGTDELTRLAEQFRRRSFKNKEVIVAQGDTPTALYYLVRGECRVIKAVSIPKGAAEPCFVEVHHYTGQEVFGNCELNSDSASPGNSEPMPVSIVADGFCEILEVQVNSLHHLSSHGAHGAPQLPSALRMVSECLRDIDRWFHEKVVELVLHQRRDWTAFKQSTLKEEIQSYDRRFELNVQDDLPLPVAVSPPRSPPSPKLPRSTPSPRLAHHRAAFVVSNNLPNFAGKPVEEESQGIAAGGAPATESNA